jgi:hypothetical protein
MSNNEPIQTGRTETSNSPPSLNEFIQAKNTQSGSPKIINNYLPNISATEIPVGVEVQREKTRTRLAGGLLGLLAFSLFGIGIYIISDTFFPQNLSEDKKNSHRELITIIWTSQVTLVSGAFGFYFGSERNGSNNS